MVTPDERDEGDVTDANAADDGGGGGGADDNLMRRINVEKCSTGLDQSSQTKRFV